MKITHKYILTKSDYLLDVAQNCVLILNKSDLQLEDFALITNITTNDIIYNPHCNGLGGTTDNGNLIFEKKLTGEMKDTDDLMVIIQENISLRGANSDELPVRDPNSYQIKDVVTQLKIIALILSEGSDVEFTERDII